MTNPYQSPRMEAEPAALATPAVSAGKTFLNGMFAGSLIGAMVGFVELLACVLVGQGLGAFMLGRPNFDLHQLALACTVFISAGSMGGLLIGLAVGLFGGIGFHFLQQKHLGTFRRIWVLFLALINGGAMTLWGLMSISHGNIFEISLLSAVTLIGLVGGWIAGMLHVRALVYSLKVHGHGSD
ncbi:hypothetical protein [Lignipirellula cremea]|uniref:Uncharacterized protein n=1 Tax=Lignipirellula cremea TaxID=2528010 RepID=A0A518DPN7_9BACT|nr:hypothetical protein [Lignipirellula cremea]QDU93810.1 hypothetical protein Pla8534_15930 [Lignipirellula cremea]